MTEKEKKKGKGAVGNFLFSPPRTRTEEKGKKKAPSRWHECNNKNACASHRPTGYKERKKKKEGFAVIQRLQSEEKRETMPDVLHPQEKGPCPRPGNSRINEKTKKKKGRKRLPQSVRISLT